MLFKGQDTSLRRPHNATGQVDASEEGAFAPTYSPWRRRRVSGGEGGREGPFEKHTTHAPVMPNVTVTPTTHKIMPMNVTDGVGSSVWNRAKDFISPVAHVNLIKTNSPHKKKKVLQLC